MYNQLKKYNLLSIFRKICFNRLFEYAIAKYNKEGLIRSPVYLSIGQEHIPAILSELINPDEWLIFLQHRCHSYLLSFGAPPQLVAEELLGIPTGGLHGGTCGSASLDYKNIFGHSGLLGDQVPIAVGAAHASKKPTLCILGDGAAEEDYVLGALGFATTKKAPVLFICEDNNLSILTEKKVRRTWNIDDVCRGFGIPSYNIADYPNRIFSYIRGVINYNNFPCFININVCRHMWHAGTGTDGPPKWNTYETMKEELKNSNINTDEIEKQIQQEVDEIWRLSLKQLKK